VLKLAESVHATDPFGAADYWACRLGEGALLEATGTRPFSEAYQRYLYRLKELAILRLLRPLRSRLRGARVLNVGCGWGHFEPFFDDVCSAVEVVGIDFVDDAIAQLRTSRPQYTYLKVDISEPLPEALAGRSFDVVTAIDVLYHIVEPARFDTAIANLCSLCRPDGGVLLWTDAPSRRYDPAHPHCRYRDWSVYGNVLEQFGLTQRAVEPMYCCFDTYNRWTEWLGRYPSVTYPAMYAFDRFFARWNLRRTTNHCALAVRNQVWK